MIFGRGCDNYNRSAVLKTKLWSECVKILDFGEVESSAKLCQILDNRKVVQMIADTEVLDRLVIDRRGGVGVVVVRCKK
ncbi:hypothetical protein SERLA73DRAFT_179175 [Serpula lacrymans var. lacrymans S7.3]|uniref:Uncharacterized protein n=2 Tax=Serpula lacrymans var. lacrymans TaxID=341189 RepID=F8PRH6_SERL3|nr:uncharacterized protein SERLADRAFT_385845 [Serpula lacrymans var. lacrymans S7.9]EGO01115.1 hypothetical protein SERLA73DRAFT_179175 [Serpula lacrymans var. lacrymans S7.3]EGO26770.1 hypothetical protein SERLADRAFT_385845 [Serpula lacrymans var. lacrymans S7.9]